jgi:hypothetical protein
MTVDWNIQVQLRLCHPSRVHQCNRQVVCCSSTQAMPAFLRSEMTINISQRTKLLNHIMDVLARYTGGDSLGAQ